MFSSNEPVYNPFATVENDPNFYAKQAMLNQQMQQMNSPMMMMQDQSMLPPMSAASFLQKQSPISKALEYT